MRVIMLCLLSFASTAIAGTPLPDGPHLVVSEQGKVTTTPDSVRVTFQFESRSPQVATAKKAVDQAVNRLLDGLGPFAIRDADIRASDLTTSEDVEYTDAGKRVSNGYEADRSVTVILHQLDKLNDLLDFGLDAGASHFGKLEFESTRADELRSEARQAAVDNARQKALETAKSFGAALGPVYSIDSINSRVADGWNATSLDRVTVTGSHGQQNARYIQPTVEYSAAVNVVFELKR